MPFLRARGPSLRLHGASALVSEMHHSYFCAENCIFVRIGPHTILEPSAFPSRGLLSRYVQSGFTTRFNLTAFSSISFRLVLAVLFIRILVLVPFFAIDEPSLSLLPGSSLSPFPESLLPSLKLSLRSSLGIPVIYVPVCGSRSSPSGPPTKLSAVLLILRHLPFRPFGLLPLSPAHSRLKTSQKW